MCHKLVCIALLFTISLTASGQNMTDAKGNKTGPWKVYYPDGKLRYEASFVEGKPVGQMTRYKENGTLSAIMQFSFDSKRCYAKLYRNARSLSAEGLYIDQKKDSVWSYYASNGSLRMKETYKDGLLSGVSTSYYPSGNISQETMFVNGKRNGRLKQYYDNGVLRQVCNYKDNKLHGRYETYYINSTPESSGNYYNDLLDGEWTYYSEEGETKSVLKYIKGEIQNRDELQEKYDEFQQFIEDSIGKIPDPEKAGF